MNLSTTVMRIGIVFCVLLLWVPIVWSVETARVKMVGGVPTMVFDGTPVRARIFWSRTDKTIPPDIKGNPTLESQVKLASETGVNMVSFLLRDWWKTPEGKWDYQRLDEICDRILLANPHALLIPRPGLNAPKWWLEQNPDENIVWKNNNPQQKENGWCWASPASIKYRREACRAMAEFVRHMEEKYGPSVVGYHPYGQNTGEWFTPNTWLAGDADFGQAGLNAWRVWLKKKYRTDAALHVAWGDTGVTLDAAQVPSSELRNEAKSSPLLEPAKDKRYQILVDHNVFFQSQMTDTILAIAKTTREMTHGRKMVWLFYGYNFEFGRVPKGPA
ncbi:MAG: beta-galactosidase, partial [Verrucomicrobia bacterium]|nr:beta-galactosidase [Verrucomicrobiota bacterium]